MFRINLNKIQIILLVFLFCSSQLIAGEGEKQIIDERGNPVPFAVVQVEGKKPLTVDAQGKIELELLDGKRVLVFALGYETLSLEKSQWESLDTIVLREKSGQLQEVVVAATRTDRTVEDLPMPVSVISEEKIRQTGGMRLSEILLEQTGLQIASDHGAGLQMQGLDSDYILILLDGEPLIGRTAGTFDLDRMSVSNIERIEILRGPSSAIYGSEAMAGVVNIITKSGGKDSRIDLGLRHRSFNSWNPHADIQVTRDRWNVGVMYDYFQTEGFDLTPEVVGQTQNPFQAHTLQLKTGYTFSPKWKFNVFLRKYSETSTGELSTTGNSGSELLDLDNFRRDLNLNPTLTFKPSEDWLFTLRGMSSWFETESDTRFREDGGSFDFQEFRQFYHRTELQIDKNIGENQLFTLGVGQLTESVEATRYDDLNRFDAGYFFLQHQWDPGAKVNLVTGLRGDLHSQYGGRISPKISGQYKFSDRLSWQASIGAGFKAPDFRQLLLNFNNAASGYYVFGSNLAQEGIARLQEQGLVARVLIQPETLGQLEAETSWAVNTGFRWKASQKGLLQVNAFRNHIDNLIETAPIAQLITGQNAFSYFNIRSVVTQGVEVDFSYNLLPNLSLSAGYAFLDTRDTEVLDRIDSGEVFKRDAQNRTSRVTRADYGGLFNRSRHSGNVKINYRVPITGIDLSGRAIYRGRFGFADLNGNLILDDNREYADGWVSLNLTASKTFSNQILVELGGTNLLNTATPAQPNNPGRVIFLGLKIPILNLIQ